MPRPDYHFLHFLCSLIGVHFHHVQLRIKRATEKVEIPDITTRIMEKSTLRVHQAEPLDIIFRNIEKVQTVGKNLLELSILKHFQLIHITLIIIAELHSQFLSPII